jgi:hypothetical protein
VAPKAHRTERPKLDFARPYAWVFGVCVIVNLQLRARAGILPEIALGGESAEMASGESSMGQVQHPNSGENFMMAGRW